ncbi:g1567 [Coccomyxa elongata]
MAPKRKATAAASALSEKPAKTAAAKRRKSSVAAKPKAKPASSTQTAVARRRKTAAAAAAEESKPAPKAVPAKKARASAAAAGLSAEKALALPKAKRAKLAPVPEAPEEPGLQPVEHFSHLKVAGEVYVLGEGDCGQLGKGEDVAEAPRPQLSPIPGEQVTQVAPGGMHSVALTPDGGVYTTGVNDEGALGRESGGELWEKSGLAKGDASDTYTWGAVDIPSDHGKVIQVSAGDSHTMALTELGFVWGWGTFRDSSGVLGFSPTQRIALVPTLVHEPAVPEDQAVKIASGADHVLALTRGGVLLSWGNGQQGQLGRVGSRMRELMATILRPHPVPFTRRLRGIPVPKFVDVACGTYSSFALAQGGHVFAWGLNNYGQLALPGQEPIWAPTLVKALEGKDIALIRPGQHHTLFLTSTGVVLSAGRPTYGRLGRREDGLDSASDDAKPQPGEVTFDNGGEIAGLAAGLAVSGAFDKDGKAWLWGFGTNGQLGKGSDDDADEEVPKVLAETKRFSGRKVVQLEFGGQHTLLLTVPAAPAGAPAAAVAPTAVPAGNVPAAAEASAAEEAAAQEGEQGVLVEKKDPILAEEGAEQNAPSAAKEDVPMEVGDAAQQAEESSAVPAPEAVSNVAPAAAVPKKAKARAAARGKGAKKQKAEDASVEVRKGTAEPVSDDAEPQAAAAPPGDTAGALGLGKAEAAAAPSNLPAPQEGATGVEEAAPGTDKDDAVAMEVEEATAPADDAVLADVAVPAGKPKQAKPRTPAKGGKNGRKRKAAEALPEDLDAAAPERGAAVAAASVAEIIAAAANGHAANGQPAGQPVGQPAGRLEQTAAPLQEPVASGPMSVPASTED